MLEIRGQASLLFLYDGILLVFRGALIRKHNLKKISPHGFRHTHATLMIEMGIDSVNTAKRLGHASSQMTLDTYSHATKADEKQSITKFAEYLNKAK